MCVIKSNCLIVIWLICNDLTFVENFHIACIIYPVSVIGCRNVYFTAACFILLFLQLSALVSCCIVALLIEFIYLLRGSFPL